MMDMGASTSYLGFDGGLYGAGSNLPPSDHGALGSAYARGVTPLDTSGNPSPSGKIVLISIGFSNATQEWCSSGGAPPCDPNTFTAQALADASVNHTTLAIVNGAFGGQATPLWDSATQSNYDRVRDTVLTPAGLTERQVQIAWFKCADVSPTVALPSPNADYYTLSLEIAKSMRALRSRYPNLKMVFLSSRTYAGFAVTALNPEPYAYQGGFAVRNVIQAQIAQERTGKPDPVLGDLSAPATAPWLAWAAYLWTNGPAGRSDGYSVTAPDYQSDGTHPGASLVQKVGGLLLSFFKTSAYTKCWFLASGPAC
jgi:hypothetical protein